MVALSAVYKYNKSKSKAGEKNMSVCTFIASDFPLTEVMPVPDHPLEISPDNGTIYDDGAEDNFLCASFRMFPIIPTGKTESVWNGAIQKTEQSE